MEIEEENSNFSKEIHQNIKNYLNLMISFKITNEMIYDQFSELFSCDFHIKNTLTTKVVINILF